MSVVWILCPPRKHHNITYFFQMILVLEFVSRRVLKHSSRRHAFVPFALLILLMLYVKVAAINLTAWFDKGLLTWLK